MADLKRENTQNSEIDYMEDANRLLDRAKELQDSAASLNSKIRNEEQAMCQKAAALESDIRRLRSLVEPEVKNGSINLKDAEKLEEELYKAKCVITDGDVSWLLPSKANGRFLKMFLGPINVRATRKDIQLKVKEEYNSYRDRTAILFLLFPCTLLFLRIWIWNVCFPALPVQAYQAWLLFLYTCLALRENILRVNGSDIRPWWIYHHYCAMLMALVSLTWEIKGQPNCAEKQRGVHLFLAWAVMQGVTMLLQNKYQRQRLYTRIALGKARRMDVVGGETAGVEGQIRMLYPMIIILQLSEAGLGIMLLKTALVGVVSEWQVVVCGILLVVMAIGNSVNTWQIVVKKWQHKAKMREAKASRI